MIWCYHNDTTCHFHNKGRSPWPLMTYPTSTHIQSSKHWTSPTPPPKSSSQTEPHPSPLDHRPLSIVATMAMMETRLESPVLKIMYSSQPIIFWRYPWRLVVNPIESFWWLPNPDHQLSISSSIDLSKKTKGATQMGDSNDVLRY